MRYYLLNTKTLLLDKKICFYFVALSKPAASCIVIAILQPRKLSISTGSQFHGVIRVTCFQSWKSYSLRL